LKQYGVRRFVVSALVVVSLALLTACAGSSDQTGSVIGAVPTPTDEEKLGGPTPFPTFPAVIDGCQHGPNAECPGADLSDMDLKAHPRRPRREALEGNYRDPVDFTRADLKGANFSESDVSGMILEEADIRDANFHLADVTEAVLLKADARGADFTEATLKAADLKDANLSGADFTGASIKGADLSRADLTDAILRDAVLMTAFLTDANLTGADLTGANLSFADLDGAILCNTTMEDGTINNEGCP